MYNDNDYDYKTNSNGKDFFIKLDLTKSILYSWQSTSVHLAEGAGGCVSFSEFQSSLTWQKRIKDTYGENTFQEIIQKTKSL